LFGALAGDRVKLSEDAAMATRRQVVEVVERNVCQPARHDSILRPPA